MFSRLSLFIALAFGFVSAAADAAEGEVALGVAVDGGAGLDSGRAGIGAEAQAQFGLDPFLSLQLSAGALLRPEGSSTARAWAGGVWALDVLQWVPSVDGALGVVIDPEAGRIRPAARLGLGLDRLIGFEWSVGAYARVEFLPDRLDGPRLSGGLRLLHRFEP